MPDFSTGKDQQYVAPGAAGTVLASNGANRNPSYQAVAGLLPPSALLIQQATVVLSTADLLALPGTVKPLLGAPGSGVVRTLLYMIFQYKAGATPFTIAASDNAFQAVYHGDTHPVISAAATAFVDQAASQVLKGTQAQPVLPQTTVAAKGIDLTLGGTTPGLTAGNGSLIVTVFYIDVSLQ